MTELKPLRKNTKKSINNSAIVKKTKILLIAVAAIVIYLLLRTKSEKTQRKVESKPMEQSDSSYEEFYDPTTGYYHDPNLSGAYYENIEDFKRDKELQAQAFREGRTVFFEGRYITPEEYEKIRQNRSNKGAELQY